MRALIIAAALAVAGCAHQQPSMGPLQSQLCREHPTDPLCSDIYAPKPEAKPNKRGSRRRA
jgi:hypothetical protein